MSLPNQLRGMAPVPAELMSLLEPGEQVLWSGRPIFSRYVRSGSWFMIPFSIMWGGFAIFWEVTAISSGAPLVFDLWGIPFVLIGLYMIFGRYFVLARQARTATYLVTDRRVVIVGGVLRRRLIEMRLGSLPPVMVDQDLSGIGTITFGVPSRNTSVRRSGFPAGTAADEPPSFIAIERPSDVARIIDQARAAAEGRAPAEPALSW